ncbi:MAG: SDR family oxidoreductase [Gammaproteobacteria bacterium]|nr:SDR family oxidoreductase [Gammaproteobacteria bacterium]
MQALIVGCGDVGCRLALRLQLRGIGVTGVVRSAASATALARLGITPRIADLDADVIADLPAADWLFHFAPPPETGETDPRLVGVLAALGAPPSRFIYLSTSAVYGDCEGRWIDEQESLKPKSARGHRRLDAERTTLAYARDHGIAAMILRVPGIYGPGRLPLQRLNAGTPLVQRDQSPYTNRIHADDLASAAQRVAELGIDGAAYNVSDGQPTTMTDYFLRCARLLGVPPPPEQPLAEAMQSMSPMLKSFLEESKRLSNRRLVEELGWRPQYPSLDSGLPASLDADLVVRAFAGAA